MIKQFSLFIFSAMLVFFSTTSMAADEAPQQVVQSTVDVLLKDLQANKAKYKTNPEAFHQALHNILSPVVDVDGIARSVMTIKYTRLATPKQMETFKTNFEKGLMQFYGNALLEYENQGIKVLRTTPTDDPARVSVAMEIKGNNNTVYPVSYTMVNLNNKWVIRNVIVNGLNIGKLFRDQFANEMKNQNNNLDVVINDWSNAVKRAKETSEAAK